MDSDNGNKEIQPILSNISFIPTFGDDQGDIFQCGKCKQSFNMLMDFLSHKREHTAENYDQTTTQPLQESDRVKLVALSEQSNEIWVWSESESPANCNNIILAPDNNVNDVISNNTSSLEAVDNQKQFIETEVTTNIGEINSNFNEVTLESPAMESENENFLNASNMLTCSVCERSFKKRFDLYLHSRSHTGEKPFQCVVCGKKFSQKSNLKKHMSSHKVWPDGLSKTLPQPNFGSHIGFMCPYCQKHFDTYIHLRAHLKEHRHQKVFKCIQKQCIAMFVDLDSLISHINIHHPTIEYCCHVCSTVVSSLNELSDHQKTHKLDNSTNTRVYSCIYCKAIFKKHHHLTHHLSTANHVNNCNQCGKSFLSEKALRRHLHLHNGTRLYGCEICGSSFRSKHHLSSHILTHNKEKKFVCVICNTKFARKDILTRHIKIHQPNKKKPCPFKTHLGCTMKFTRTDKLNQHVKSHTDKANTKRNFKKDIKCNEKDQSTIELIIVPMTETQCSISNPK